MTRRGALEEVCCTSVVAIQVYGCECLYFIGQPLLAIASPCVRVMTQLSLVQTCYTSFTENRVITSMLGGVQLNHLGTSLYVASWSYWELAHGNRNIFL